MTASATHGPPRTFYVLFGKRALDLVIGGTAGGAAASTVVSLVDGFEVLREGPIDVAQLRAALA